MTIFGLFIPMWLVWTGGVILGLGVLSSVLITVLHLTIIAAIANTILNRK